MGADKRRGVAANALDSLTRPFQMRARAVDARLIHHVGDVQISRSWTGGQGCRFDDHIPADVVDAGWIGELQMMDPAVHAIHHQIDPLTHIVAGQSLAKDAANDRLR
jgi:hypothetical protein